MTADDETVRVAEVTSGQRSDATQRRRRFLRVGLGVATAATAVLGATVATTGTPVLQALGGVFDGSSSGTASLAPDVPDLHGPPTSPPSDAGTLPSMAQSSMVPPPVSQPSVANLATASTAAATPRPVPSRAPVALPVVPPSLPPVLPPPPSTTRPSQPSQPTRPAQPTQPTRPSQPTKPSGPTTEPTKPTKPSDKPTHKPTGKPNDKPSARPAPTGR